MLDQNISQTTINQECLQENICLEYIENILGWITQKETQIKIFITDSQEIIYFSLDGFVLRIDNMKAFNYKQLKLLKNITQIKQLQWVSCNKNCTEIDTQIATFQGQALLETGGNYNSENGKKNGVWSDLSQNFQQISYVIEIGRYNNDKRVGIWKYKYQNEKIDGGTYDENGLRQGEWRELSQNFWDFSQVIYEGQYKNDLKSERWNIKYRENGKNKFQNIGGGQFEKFGFKNSKWIELSNNFCDYSQVIYVGDYKNDLKVGLWEIHYRKNDSTQFQIFGQGLFDEQGQKNGRWREINENCYRFSQISYDGEYKNGKRIGKWQINYQRDYNQEQEIIGGGSYNIQGQKQGIWIELSNLFQMYQKFYNQIIYTGEYRSGIKYGVWEIKHRKDVNKYFEKIGGGLYNIQGQKHDEWIDITDNFYQNITHHGKYQNGLKYGRWVIYYRNGDENPQKLYGGGQYNELGFKDKNWVELIDNLPFEVTFEGEYKNGKKIGVWNINYTKVKGQMIEIIGGGQYDNQMLKNGQWLDISNSFWDYCQVQYNGKYKNGIKQGRWDINFRKNESLKFQGIGGGIYTEFGFKHGNWIDLIDLFQEDYQLVCKGEYKWGFKSGRWNTEYRKNCESNFGQVGGGSYDSHGLKRGKWLELNADIQGNLLIILKGEYIQNQKIGIWDTIYRRINDGNMELLGCGFYDFQGQKNGKWLELTNQFYEDNQAIIIGEYIQGKKVGKWNVMQNDKNRIYEEFQHIEEEYFQ